MTIQRGFTLIELMVTLAVAAILITVGAPAFSTFIQNNRITSTTNFVVSQINFARSEAVRLNSAVNIARKGATAKDLGDGWQIYSDAGSTTGNSAYDSSNDTLLREFDGYGNQDVTVLTDNAGNQWIGFAANGTLAEGGSSVVIAVCDSRGVAFGRLITVSPTGRALVTDANAATDPLTTCTP